MRARLFKGIDQQTVVGILMVILAGLVLSLAYSENHKIQTVHSSVPVLVLSGHPIRLSIVGAILPLLTVWALIRKLNLCRIGYLFGVILAVNSSYLLSFVAYLPDGTLKIATKAIPLVVTVSAVAFLSTLRSPTKALGLAYCLGVIASLVGCDILKFLPFVASGNAFGHAVFIIGGYGCFDGVFMFGPLAMLLLICCIVCTNAYAIAHEYYDKRR